VVIDSWLLQMPNTGAQCWTSSLLHRLQNHQADNHLTRNSNILKTDMNTEIQTYNNSQTSADKEICDFLANSIDSELTEAEKKIWHAHPVWFLDGNPIVGYSKQKKGIRLMFWSGADFEEENLNVKGEKFKDASIFFNNVSEIETNGIKRWLKKSREIQWDYKNIVKRKGHLERLK
jgi:uncharacterized protein YdhG (YjbR/CyaY superfamily)